MIKVYATLIGLAISLTGFSQSCLQDGIEFTTQAQIDNFQANYPNCTEIEGGVIIRGVDIANLDGLSIVTYIGGNLELGYYEYGGNPSLTNLTGLNGLTNIGGGIHILDNNLLTNLTGLDNLITIGGDLWIEYNSNLNSFIGMDNVTSIGGQIQIKNNDALANLSGLDNLTSIGSHLVICDNPNLTSIDGLDNLAAASIDGLAIYGNSSLSSCAVQSICGYLANPNGYVIIHSNASGCNNPPEIANECGITLPCLPFGNYYFFTQADIDNFQINYPQCTELQQHIVISGDDITNLSGLNVVTSIGGLLQIENNSALTSLTGLNSLIFVGGNLLISDNDALTSLTGLEDLTSIGGSLIIYHNHNLTNLTGLDSLTSIEGGLYISENYALTSLTGLEGITSVGEILQIRADTNLTSLTGLNELTSVGRWLSITSNDALTSLTGLEGLTSTGEGLIIYGNCCLNNLAALESLNSIGGLLIIGAYEAGNTALTSLTGLDNINAESITSLHITYNSSLSTCDVQSICDYLAIPNGDIEFHDNATGCNSQEEVEAACGVGVDNNVKISDYFSIYPNPTSSSITLSTPTTPTKNTFLTIYNLSGQQLLTRRITNQTSVLDIGTLSSGVYFVRITTDRTVMVGKFLKQ